MISHLTEVYWLLLTLKDSGYVGGLYCSMVTWAYQKRVNGFAYQMFQENASIGNEESGELAFSMIGRKTIASSSKSKLELVNRTFSDMRTYADASKDMRIGTQLSMFHTGGRETIKEKSESVGATLEHFRAVIRALGMNVHQAYDGEVQGYKNKAAGSKHQIPLHGHRRFLATKVRMRTHEIRKKVAAKLDTPWAYQFTTVWPTASQRPAGPDGMMVGPDSDDDSASADDDGPDEADEVDDDGSSSDNGSSSDDMAQDVQDVMQELQELHDEQEENKHDTDEIKQSREDEKRNEQSDSDNQINEDYAVTSDPDIDDFDEFQHNLSEQEREVVDSREEKMRTYEALPQEDRDKAYREHTDISNANLVQGKRVRKSNNKTTGVQKRRKARGND